VSFAGDFPLCIDLHSQGHYLTVGLQGVTIAMPRKRPKLAAR
jgi:hypothetical protein